MRNFYAMDFIILHLFTNVNSCMSYCCGISTGELFFFKLL